MIVPGNDQRLTDSFPPKLTRSQQPSPPGYVRDIGDLNTGLYSAMDLKLESRAAFLVKQRAEMRARGDFSELPHKVIY